ncbi:MAG: TfpX/TfpZ family type IV pilin accessory protein [Rhodanobacter sp.]
MSRWKAAAIHLLISLSVAATVATLLYTLWFPPPYFRAAGANELVPLLMGVDIVLGPLLTLVAFSPGKPWKLRRLDLSIIVALQCVAFGYGFYVVCQARPVFIVAESDRLILVTANDLSDADLAKGSRPAYRSRSWSGPRLVGALPPTGEKVADFTMQVLAGGKDIDQRPEFYVPYDQVTGDLMKHALPLALLKPVKAEQRDQLAQLESTAAANGQLLRFVPLQRRPEDYAVIFASDPGRPIAVLAIDPWVTPIKK